MGKASRKKKERKDDLATIVGLFESGMCTKCGRTKRLVGSPWCGICHANGRRRRAARRPRPLPKQEMKAELDALIEELS